jgi:hypothetical protein
MSASGSDVPADEELNAGHGLNLWAATTQGFELGSAAYLKSVYTKRNTAPGAGTSIQVIPQDDTVDISAATVTVSNTDTTGNVTSLTTSIGAGSVVTLRYNTASGAPTHDDGSVGLLFNATVTAAVVAAIKRMNLTTLFNPIGRAFFSRRLHKELAI